jgi:hypothetical protein
MPTGFPKRGKKFRFLDARNYLGIKSKSFRLLIERGILPPDGRMPTGESFWYADTLDRSPIRGTMTDSAQ